MDRTTEAESVDRSGSVLVLAPVGRDAELTAKALRRVALPCRVCSTADELITEVRRGAGPAVIGVEALSVRHGAALESVLADQPAWSDPPLILVAGPASLPEHLRKLVARQNTTLLHRPLKVSTFVTTARAALQNRLRQYEVQRLLDRLEERARQLQRLALELTDAEERERQRLAEILHDDLQQLLVGARMRVAGLSKGAEQDRFDKTVQALSELLSQAIEQSRNLSHEFNLAILRREGLPAALRWLAKRMNQLHELTVTTDADPDADLRDGWVRTFLYRSAQELLFNVAKHAGVSEAHVRLAREESRVVLCVQDGGELADMTALEKGEAGCGLQGIRERASLLGGSFEIDGDEAVGTTFTLAMPLEPASATIDPAKPGEAATPATVAADSGVGGQELQRLRIMLVDDHQMMRSGLRSLLELEQDLEIVGEADDGVQAQELAERLRPDLILMDVSMPQMDGIEATRRIKARHPAMRVIGLSMFDDERCAITMRDAGAECYLPKVGPAEDLLAAVRAIRSVHRGAPG